MKQTGGDALARQLALEGVTDVFGVPGVQLDWAVDGLRKMQDRIRYLVARHVTLPRDPKPHLQANDTPAPHRNGSAPLDRLLPHRNFW